MNNKLVTKPMAKPISSYIELLTPPCRLLLNHPLQRSAEQWGREQQGNFIRRILENKFIIPIIIARQYDEETGCYRDWLIDGKQRMTTIYAFRNDDFAISSKIRNPYITFQGFKYETKIFRGREVPKKDKTGKYIPILDEDGNPIPQKYTIDIRKLKYSDLPPELQKRFDDYNIKEELLLDCKDSDIRDEILDHNNGSKMKPEQKGMACLGVDLALQIRKLIKHDFIIDCCSFSNKDKGIDLKLRSVNEALMLTNFPQDWKKKPEDLCNYLAENATQEHIDHMKYMFDDLQELFMYDDTVKGWLKAKEFFIVIANYSHFLSLDYKKECYADFLHKWVNELIDTPILDLDNENNELDENDVIPTYNIIAANNTKAPGCVNDRLNTMNDFLDKYLQDNFGTTNLKNDAFNETDNLTNMAKTQEDCVSVDEENSIDEMKLLELIQHPIVNRLVDQTNNTVYDFAIKALMVTSEIADGRFSGFDDIKKHEFCKTFNTLETSEQKIIIDECQYFMECLDEYLVEVSYDSQFITEENLLCLLNVIKTAQNEEIDDQIITEWIADFESKYAEDSQFINMSTEFPDYTVMSKISRMYRKLKEYQKSIQEGE